MSDDPEKKKKGFGWLGLIMGLLAAFGVMTVMWYFEVENLYIIIAGAILGIIAMTVLNPRKKEETNL